MTGEHPNVSLLKRLDIANIVGGGFSEVWDIASVYAVHAQKPHTQ